MVISPQTSSSEPKPQPPHKTRQRIWQYKRMGKALARHFRVYIGQGKCAFQRRVLNAQMLAIRQDVGLMLFERRHQLDIMSKHQQDLGMVFEKAALGVACRIFPYRGGWNLTSETALRILSEIQSCSYCCEAQMTPNSIIQPHRPARFFAWFECVLSFLLCPEQFIICGLQNLVFGNTAPVAKLIPNPKARLREQVREVMRFHYYALRTEEAYWQWIKRLMFFHRQRLPRELGPAPATAFLRHLTTDFIHVHSAADTIPCSVQNPCHPRCEANMRLRGQKQGAFRVCGSTHPNFGFDTWPQKPDISLCQPPDCNAVCAPRLPAWP